MRHVVVFGIILVFGVAAGADAPPDGAGSVPRGPADRAAADTTRVAATGGLRRLTLSAAEARGGVVLPDSLIIAGTDTVRLSDVLLERDSEYLFDAAARFFRLRVDPGDAADVRLRYRFLPGVERAVFRAALVETAGRLPEAAAAAEVIVEAEPPAKRAVGPDLRIDGAKTFGVTVGSNRDPTLEQSLRLNVTGRIAGDVSVRAYLSDQNVPLRPEGDTEELRALDEVLVELESPLGRATLGDFVLSTDRSRLASMERELSGAEIEGRIGPGSFVLAGARAEGEYRSVTFRGVDGKQGQYVLGDGGPIVAGSERVWVDGQPMRRGRDNDYVIDYDAGTIEFTERRPITSESEISVDFDSAAGDYARDVYAVRGGVGAGESGLGVTWIREADDRDAPSSIVIGDEERAILAAAGDDPLEAYDAGVDSVGPGEGDYVRVAPGEFEYAGADSGAFDLAFERVEGGGYEYDYVEGHYVFVGEGEGTHRLGRTLPLPIEHDVVSIDGRHAFGERGWLEGEAAVSRFDANAFSAVDDDDNLGNATALDAGVRSGPVGWLGGGIVAASLSGRRVAGGFRTVGRFREVGYEERWELQGLELPAGELLGRAEASVTFPEGGRVALSRAGLRRGDAVSTDRTEFSADGRPLSALRLQASGRLVDVVVDGTATDEERSRRACRAALDMTSGVVRPGVRYARDRRTVDGAGERYDEYGAVVRFGGEGRFDGAVTYDYRLTDRSDGGGWDLASTTRTEEYRFSWDGSRELFAEIVARRRRTEFEEGFADPGTRNDLVSARLTRRSSGGRFRGELRYSVTSTEVEEKEKYVTEEDGVEVTRIISTGRYRPVTELEAAAKWTVDGGAGRGRLPEATPLGRFLTSLRLSSDIKLRESTTTDDRWGLYRLDPDVIQGDDTVEGEITSRHALRYLSPGGGTSVRLTVETRDDLDRRYTNAPETRTERSGAVDLKVSSVRGVTWRLVGELGRRERSSEGALDSYRIDDRSLLGETTVRRFGSVELRASALVGSEDEALTGVTVTRYEVSPGLTWRFRGRGSLSASVTRAEVEADTDELPVYLGGGRRAGGTTLWRLTGDYRVNRYLTATLAYTGERRSGSEALQTVDLRVNAYF